MTARDNPDILGRVSTMLGDEGVGIESILAREQDGASSSTISVIVWTRFATQDALHSALRRISALSEISGSPRLIWIEEVA
jgi:predicted regulator of amino acid metabolism with ACT domain